MVVHRAKPLAWLKNIVLTSVSNSVRFQQRESDSKNVGIVNITFVPSAGFLPE